MSPHAVVWTDHTSPYGVGRFSQMLSDGLRHHGWEVTFAAGVDLFGDSPMRAFVDGETPAALIDDAKPDVVVFVNASPLSNVAAQRAARERGVTRVVVVQGTGVTPPVPNVEILAGVAAVELRAAHAVVTPSHALLAELRSETIGLDAGSVIENGVPDAFFVDPSGRLRHDARAEYDLPDDAIVCLSGARMEHEKGWDLLLEAAARVIAGGDEHLHFLWAGDGTKRKRLLALARMRGLQDRVRVVGLVHDMVPLVQLSDVFVLPTRNDVAPFAILEAMAGGLAVISTDVREIASMIGDAGIVLADPGHVEREATIVALAAALVSLAEDDGLRHDLGARARERANAEHRATSMVARYDALLRALV